MRRPPQPLGVGGFFFTILSTTEPDAHQQRGEADTVSSSPDLSSRAETTLATMTGAQSLIASLEAADVDVVFDPGHFRETGDEPSAAGEVAHDRKRYPVVRSNEVTGQGATRGPPVDLCGRERVARIHHRKGGAGMTAVRLDVDHTSEGIAGSGHEARCICAKKANRGA